MGKVFRVKDYTFDLLLSKTFDTKEEAIQHIKTKCRTFDLWTKMFIEYGVVEETTIK